MNSKYDDFFQKANSKSNWFRDDVSTTVIDFISYRDKFSQREFAKKNNVPRTTLQRWLNRINTIDADPDLIAFFESPAGINFLHLLIQALHFEFTKVGCASIHNICNFLETCRLSRFVGASYGTHQRISNQMDLMLTDFGDIGFDHNCGHNVTGSVPPLAGFSSTIRGMPATGGTPRLRTAKYGRSYDQTLILSRINPTFT